MCDRPLCVNYGAPPQRKMSTKKRRENDFGYLFFFCGLLSLLPLFFSSCCVCVYVCVSVVLFSPMVGRHFHFALSPFRWDARGDLHQHTTAQRHTIISAFPIGAIFRVLLALLDRHRFFPQFASIASSSSSSGTRCSRDTTLSEEIPTLVVMAAVERSVFIQKMCQSKLGRGTFRHIVNS